MQAGIIQKFLFFSEKEGVRTLISDSLLLKVHIH